MNTQSTLRLNGASTQAIMPHCHSNRLQLRSHRCSLQRHKRAFHGIWATSNAMKLAFWYREPFAQTTQFTSNNLDPRLPLGSMKLHNNGIIVVFNTVKVATSLREADEWASVLRRLARQLRRADVSLPLPSRQPRKFRDAQIVVSFSVVVPVETIVSSGTVLLKWQCCECSN